ncbi:hypothetical protein [Maliponia aquimaris]|uniref:Uncharacterized protein n=1 Tax=Maliponia aquimaris TaxID=1673631 RepID=A0A238L753_9RHOB|nr:hypothetical protein [Maliponia aquimaris]SMX50837.1 hypothetical protein MAA8898_05038 [Maliponia aquimaris]
MSDRDVKVIIALKASQIEETRRLALAMGEFPTIAWNYGQRIAAIVTKEGGTTEDAKELDELVAGLITDAETAKTEKRPLAPLIETAMIHDPEGRKGPLQ